MINTYNNKLMLNLTQDQFQANNYTNSITASHFTNFLYFLAPPGLERMTCGMLPRNFNRLDAQKAYGMAY